ncbi:MAG: hypothetical protein HYZ50_20240 [Deltaproteobacteria bacterium]|nr:hypothetical protein [Deltaproteobacteria bacterium]
MAASASNPTAAAKPASTSITGVEQYTAQQVIDMFAALNLLVTDDGNAIESEANKQRPRRLRELGSTDPAVRAKAQEWMRHLELLKNRRQELLNIVQNLFVQLADTALASALGAGVHELTSEVYENLRIIARGQCRLDERLVQRFVDAYLAKKHLKVGAPLAEPKLVESLVVTPEVGRIQLRWKLPADSCDAVVVKRHAKGAVHSATELCRGNRTEYLDEKVISGQRYVYAISSTFRGVESKSTQSIEALAIGEVTKVDPKWTAQGVKLSWTNPEGNRSVAIFRREAARPTIQYSPTGPVPTDTATRLVYRGSTSHWTDTNTEEGKTYHYLLLAEFENSAYAKGVEGTCAVPTLPVPVAAAHAKYREGGIDIWWTPPKQSAREKYLLVRQAGTTPALAPDQGQILTTTSQTSWRDTKVIPGHRYVYSIFTSHDDLHSRTGKATEVIAVLDEVSSVTPEVGDGTISLRWTSPPNAKAVVVRRSVHPPNDWTDGVPVPTIGSGHAQDTGLRNNRTYHYLICCIYQFPDGQEAHSVGLRYSATPSGLPDIVTDFRVYPDGGHVICTWSPVASGQVTVLRCPSRPSFTPGNLLSADQLAALGQQLSPSSLNRIEDTAPTPQEPYYAAFTVAGSRAVAGPVHSCIVTEDVKNLQALQSAKGVKLSWDWPVNCQAVVIARRRGEWPEGPNDPRATPFHWTLNQYQQEEGFRDALEPDSGEYCYIVYAKPAGTQEVLYAPGTSSGCRCRVRPVRVGQFTYSIKIVKKWLKPAQLELTWEADAYPHAFSGFVVLGSSRSVPKSLADGTELFRWIPEGPEDFQPGRQQRQKILQELNLQRSTGRLYWKLFLLNPDESLLIRHPDVSHPLELS